MLIEELSSIGLVDAGEKLGLAPQAPREPVRAVVGKVRCHGINDDDDGVTQLGKVLEVIRAQLHHAQVFGEDVHLAGVDPEGRGRVGTESCRGDQEQHDYGAGAALDTSHPGRGKAAEILVDGANQRSKAGLGGLGGHVTQGSTGPRSAIVRKAAHRARCRI
jgi:hypothetical protein